MFLLVVSGLMTCVALRLSRRRALLSRLRLLLVMTGLRCLLMCCRLQLFAAGLLALILPVLLLPLILLVYLLLPLIVLAYRLLLLQVRLPLIHGALLIPLTNLFLPPLIVLAYRLLLLQVRLPLIHGALLILLINLFLPPLIVLAYRLLLLQVRLPLIHRALLVLLINLLLPLLIVLANRLLLLQVRLPLIHRVLLILLISLLPLIRLDHRVLLTIIALLGLIFPIPMFAQPVGMITRDPTRILVVPPFAIMPPALRVECAVLIAPSRVERGPRIMVIVEEIGVIQMPPIRVAPLMLLVVISPGSFSRPLRPVAAV
jgi:hypothetical protein